LNSQFREPATHRWVGTRRVFALTKICAPQKAE
jgi:hypothetical protein